MGEEFTQQLGLGVEHVRHAPGIHRDAIDELLIGTAKAAVQKYANRKSDAITAAMRAASAGDPCRSMMSSNTSGIFVAL